MLKKCLHCGKEFKTVRASLYCGVDCKRLARNAREKAAREEGKNTKHTCALCGRAFVGTPCQKYCGSECRAKALSKSTKKAAQKKAAAKELKSQPAVYQPRCHLERVAMEATAAGMSYGQYQSKKMLDLNQTHKQTHKK